MVLSQADIIIASRYVPGGVTYTSFVRDWLKSDYPGGAGLERARPRRLHRSPSRRGTRCRSRQPWWDSWSPCMQALFPKEARGGHFKPSE